MKSIFITLIIISISISLHNANSNFNKGSFGFNGSCGVAINHLRNINIAPNLVKAISKILKYIGFTFFLNKSICIGDYHTGSIINSLVLKEAGCNLFPLQKGVYSIFAFSYNVPFQNKISLCYLFDNQNSYGLTFNLGLSLSYFKSIVSLLGFNLNQKKENLLKK